MEEVKFYLSIIQTGSAVVVLAIVLYVFFNFYIKKDEKNDTAIMERENKLFERYYESNKLHFDELKARDLQNQNFIKNLLEKMDLYSYRLTQLVEKIETNQFCPLMNIKNQKKNQNQNQKGGDNNE